MRSCQAPPPSPSTPPAPMVQEMSQNNYLKINFKITEIWDYSTFWNFENILCFFYFEYTCIKSQQCWNGKWAYFEILLLRTLVWHYFEYQVENMAQYPYWHYCLWSICGIEGVVLGPLLLMLLSFSDLHIFLFNQIVFCWWTWIVKYLE